MSKKSLMLLVVAVLAGAALWWSAAREDEHLADARQPSDEQMSVGTAAAMPVLGSADIAEGQRDAAEAAIRAVGTIAGPVKQRPAFVSAIEWQILQGVAAQHAHPEVELTRLVNHLRFSKQLEQWQALAGQADAAVRPMLAAQLLADIPARVQADEMTPADAQQLQQALLAGLVSDPNERQRRIAEEARRVGVQVAIEASTGSSQ
ncbi:MAG: hypothetical protein Q8J78_10290 [Moraxellaceae bacterium]|nr:hypothetical protein [Moraxellaceae bacterium]